MALDPIGFASFAFTAGAAAFFAPCSYPLLPGYLAYYLGTGDETRSPTLGARLSRAAAVGIRVLVGFALVYVTLGAVVVALGSSALADAVLLELVVGSGLVVVGAAMALGRSPRSVACRLPRPLSGGRRWVSSAPVRLPERRRSTAGYVLFGVCYAAAAAGCTAPLFLAVAGVSVGEGPLAAALGVGSYAAGMAALMLGVTVLSALGREALVARVGDVRIERAAGLLLVLAGAAQLYLFVFRYDGLELLGLA